MQPTPNTLESKPETFNAPGRNGFVPEKLLGRIDSSEFTKVSEIYQTMGLEEICLENIVMATLNQDILKRNFEIIINALKVQAGKMNGFLKLFSAYDNRFDEINAIQFQNDKKFGQILSNEKTSQGENNNGDVLVLRDEIKELKVYFLIFYNKKNIFKEKDSEQQIVINLLKETVEQKEIESNSNNEILNQKIRKQEEKMESFEIESADQYMRLQALEQSSEKQSEVQAKIAELTEKFNFFESKMNLIESLSSKEDGKEGPDLSGIINQISLFRNQLKDYVPNEDFQTFKDYFTKWGSDFSKRIDKFDQVTFFIDKIRKEEIPKIFELCVANDQKNIKKFEEIDQKFVGLEEKLATFHVESPPIEIPTELIEKNVKDILDKELARKVNIEDYLQVLREMDLLKDSLNQIINQMLSGGGEGNEKKEPIIIQPPITNTGNRDNQLFKEMNEKMDNFESLIRKIQRELADLTQNSQNQIKELKEGYKGLEERKLDRSEIKIDKIEELLKKSSGFESDIKLIKDKQIAIEKTMSMNEATLNDVMKELGKLRKKNSVIDNGQILTREIVGKMIEEAMKGMKKDFDKVMSELDNVINKKSGFEDLWKSEGMHLIYFSINKINGVMFYK